jgi:hypothetical protein
VGSKDEPVKSVPYDLICESQVIKKKKDLASDSLRRKAAERAMHHAPPLSTMWRAGSKSDVEIVVDPKHNCATKIVGARARVRRRRRPVGRAIGKLIFAFLCPSI